MRVFNFPRRLNSEIQNSNSYLGSLPATENTCGWIDLIQFALGLSIIHERELLISERK